MYRFWRPFCQRWPQSQEAPTNLGLREDRLACLGLSPGPAVLAAPALTFWVSPQVSFSLVAFMYRHLFSFTLPVELCSGRPNCGATQSFGGKVMLDF